MKRLPIRRPVLWVGALGLLALAALFVATSRDSRAVGPGNQPTSNGGARQWMAFDPLVETVSAHQSVNLIRVIQVANTSTATSTVTITYERPSRRPARLSICTRALAPGANTTCGGVGRASSGFADGYLLVRASQPVVMGGWIDLPVQDWERKGSAARPRLEFKNNGVLQRLPFQWQEACPPASGSGCPTGQPVLVPSVPATP